MTDLHPHLDAADHPLVKGQLVCWDVDAPGQNIGMFDAGPRGTVVRLFPLVGLAERNVPAVLVAWDNGTETITPAVWLESLAPYLKRPEDLHELCPGHPNVTKPDMFVVCEGARAGRATIEDLRLFADSASGVFRRHEGSGELTIRRYRIFRLSDQADLRPPCNSDLQLCNKGQMTAHGAGFEDAFGEMVFIAPVRDDGRPILDAVAGC